MDGRRTDKTKTPLYCALNRTKKGKLYILSRQSQTHEKTANKSPKTKVTPKWTQPKSKKHTRKRARSVPKTDETVQRHGNRGKPSDNHHERRNDGAGCQALLLDRGVKQFYLTGAKMQLYTHLCIIKTIYPYII